MILLLMNSYLENWRKLRMKVKIICNSDMLSFEKDVNAFIADKVIHDIKYQSMSIPQQYNGVGIPTSIGIFDRALIMYDDEEADYLDAHIKKEA